MKPRVLDWIVTIPFLLAFALVLLVFDVAQRVARIFGKRPQEYASGGLQVALGLGIPTDGYPRSGRAFRTHQTLRLVPLPRKPPKPL